MTTTPAAGRPAAVVFGFEATRGVARASPQRGCEHPLRARVARRRERRRVEGRMAVDQARERAHQLRHAGIGVEPVRQQRRRQPHCTAGRHTRALAARQPMQTVEQGRERIAAGHDRHPRIAVRHVAHPCNACATMATGIRSCAACVIPGDSKSELPSGWPASLERRHRDRAARVPREQREMAEQAGTTGALFSSACLRWVNRRCSQASQRSRMTSPAVCPS